MNKQRPVNLNLSTIKFPIPAIVSILHRLSGVLLFLFVPVLLLLLKTSLASEHDYQQIQTLFDNPLLKSFILFGLAGLIYHLLAGIRHLLMDAGIGESLCAGRLSAKIVLILSIVLISLAGYWIW